MDKVCENCDYWVEGVNKDTKIGRCRRYAPTANFEYPAAPLNVDFRSAEWPITQQSDWCGDFRQTENADGKVAMPIFF